MRWFARLLVCACLAPAAHAAMAAELYTTTRTSPDVPVLIDPANPGQPERRLPVLFVHGHNPDSANDSSSAGPNYQQNFWQASSGLTSFKRALDHADNAGLGIEPYYIRFADQDRSITEDARDIAAAIDLIIERHNPGFATANATISPPVQVVIVAYSKGTLSTRQYLKSLLAPVQDPGGAPLPAPRPGYRPVSEFIAVSPPNHGITIPLSPLSASYNSLARRQLNNGHSGFGCVLLGGSPAADNFIEILNGHAIADTQQAPFAAFASEAPGSRPAAVPPSPGSPPTIPTPPSAGTLYLALYAANNADLVGGDDPSADCQGRKVARNLAPDAINIALAGLSGANEGEVHANTVHAAPVICLALFASVHHKAPAAGKTCPTNADGVPVIPLPPRAAAMLALDFSGSMLAPACPGCAARLDLLKDAVEIFARLWSVMGRRDDELGVTYFRTAVDQFSVNGDALPTLDSVDALLTDMRAQTSVSANKTAMGGALQRAIEALRAPPVASGPRHVILFTDGMQNVNPMVLPRPGDPAHHVIDDEAGRTASNVTPTVPPIALDSLGGITIDTIGIGTGQAFLDLLSDIATETGGDTKATAAANDDLRRFFVEALINALRGFSPQLAGYRRGALVEGGTSEAFLLNRGARKAAFKLSWPRGAALDLRILKDGTDVTGLARITAGTFYRIYSFAFPGKGAAASSDGVWTMAIGGKPKTAYEAAAIVDDPTLAYKARLGVPRQRVGQPMTLAVEVLSGGRPVDGAISVTAAIELPRATPGNLLGPVALFESARKGSEPGASLAERRLSSLLGDPARWKTLANPSRSTVTLEPDGKGRYHATIGDVAMQGLYRAVVHIKGEDSQLGAFERSETATAVVRFNEAVLDQSRLVLRPAPARGTVELTLRPRDAHGNLLGAGLAREIAVTLAGGRTVEGPADLGDGRYRFVLPVAKGDDPVLTIEVAGRPLFKGTLAELRARSGG